MANQSNDVVRLYEYNVNPIFNDLPVAAGTNGLIFEGMVTQLNGSSGVTFSAGSTNETFVGFCAKKVDNTGGAAGALNVHLRTAGYVALAVVGAASQSNVSAAVFASDASTFTLTTGSLQIGKVHRWVTGTICIVKFEAASVRSV
jgi:hypothetical protein